MGIINHFIGGAAGGLADAGRIMLINKLQSERAEADALRESALRTGLQSDEQTFKAEQNQKDRASAEKIAGMKPAKNPQLIKYTDNEGYEQEGVLKDNSDGTYRIVKPDTGETMVDELTTEDLKNAAAMINTEEGRADDWIPFNEVAPTSDQARAWALKGKAGTVDRSGIIGAPQNRQNKGGESPSAPAASAKPTTSQVGQSNKAPYPDGTELRGPDGKLYIVKNGRPTLKPGQ